MKTRDQKINAIRKALSGDLRGIIPPDRYIISDLENGMYRNCETGELKTHAEVENYYSGIEHNTWPSLRTSSPYPVLYVGFLQELTKDQFNLMITEAFDENEIKELSFFKTTKINKNGTT